MKRGWEKRGDKSEERIKIIKGLEIREDMSKEKTRVKRGQE